MPPPQMTIMNAPSREFCTARRERTNTPLQALLLMNEQQYFKSGPVVRRQLTLAESGDDPDKGLPLLYEKVDITRSQQGCGLADWICIEAVLGDVRRDLYVRESGADWRR